MARYILEVMYDGTQFHGSQIQGETPTVQLYINHAISTILKTKTESFGASRTDEGVHAFCNFYHFDAEQELKPDFLYKCNSIIPYGMAVKCIYLAIKPDFNARFDALTRKYSYHIYTKKDPFLHKRALYYPFKLQHDLLIETASIIKEYAVFESFSKRNTQSKTFNCTIYRSEWEFQENRLMYIVEGNRFLRGMVRGLVATQLKVARGNLTIDNFKEIIEAQDCTKAFFNVEGHGLYLEHISYPEDTMKGIYL